MPSGLSTFELKYYRDQIATNGVNTAVYYYTVLDNMGYHYAGWAKGVATAQTIAGQTAVNFLQGTALMGVNGAQGRNLSTTEMNQIRVDMALAYFDRLLYIANHNGGIVNRDIEFNEAQKFHSDVFIKHQLSIDNWTLNIPMKLIEMDQGSAAVERAWQNMLSTEGTGTDAAMANAGLVGYVLRDYFSGSDYEKNLAGQWLSQFPNLTKDAFMQLWHSPEKVKQYINDLLSYTGTPEQFDELYNTLLAINENPNGTVLDFADKLAMVFNKNGDYIGAAQDVGSDPIADIINNASPSSVLEHFQEVMSAGAKSTAQAYTSNYAYQDSVFEDYDIYADQGSAIGAITAGAWQDNMGNPANHYEDWSDDDFDLYMDWYYGSSSYKTADIYNDNYYGGYFTNDWYNDNYWNGGNYYDFDNYYYDFYNYSGYDNYNYDYYYYFAPVALDLDGDGVEMISVVDSHAWFDVLGDGTKRQTGWIGKDDGLLVFDENSDQNINTAKEVSFSLRTAANDTDLEALAAEFDSNSQQQLDSVLLINLKTVQRHLFPNLSSKHQTKFQTIKFSSSKVAQGTSKHAAKRTKVCSDGLPICRSIWDTKVRLTLACSASAS